MQVEVEVRSEKYEVRRMYVAEKLLPSEFELLHFQKRGE